MEWFIFHLVTNLNRVYGILTYWLYLYRYIPNWHERRWFEPRVEAVACDESREIRFLMRGHA